MEETNWIKIGSIVLPGDKIGSMNANKVRLGPGLIQDKDSVFATKQGILRSPIANFYWIENTQKRYVPTNEDLVIGTVIEKYAESYKVDIGSAHPASLHYLAFENATKRNRPQLSVGSTIYARVVNSNKDMDPEIVCFSARNKADGFGELQEGFSFKCSLGLAYQLMDDNSVVLKILGKRIPFEIAVGMNGMVWIKSGSNSTTILLFNVILSSEFLSSSEIEKFLETILKRNK